MGRHRKLPDTNGLTRQRECFNETSCVLLFTKCRPRLLRRGFRFTCPAKPHGPSPTPTAAVNFLMPPRNRRLLMTPRLGYTQIQPGTNLELGRKTMNLTTEPWIPITWRAGDGGLVT